MDPNEIKNLTNIEQPKATENKRSSNNLKRVPKETDHIRTTIMLIIVCGLFFIAEIPQAILLFISIFDFDFYFNVYKPLGDLLDILVLINYSISFLLYCSMSQAFRDTVRSLFKSFFK